MNRTFIRNHITSFAIAIFIVIYGAIVYTKPKFMYLDDGSLRQFGVGFQRKTVLPAWLVAVVIAILSYFAVLYYISIPRMQF